MRNTTRSETKREIRVEAILERAMELLRAGGLEAVTVQRLAAELDYVPAALYRYFASKDELVAALQRRAVGVVHQHVMSSVRAAVPREAKTREAAVARILAAARAYLELPVKRPDAWALVAFLLSDPRALLPDHEVKKTAPLLVELLVEVQRLFEDAAEVGALAPGDAPRRTLVLWAALQGALALSKLRRFAPTAPDPTELGIELVRTLLHEWGAARLPTASKTRKKKSP